MEDVDQGASLAAWRALEEHGVVRGSWPRRQASLVPRWLERSNPPGSEAVTPYAAVVRTLAWHLRVGGPWQALPGGIPPWRAVCGWFQRLRDLGLFDALPRHVAVLDVGASIQQLIEIVECPWIICVG